MLELFKVTVQNRIKDGYCRAGRVLPIGESTLEALTAEQVSALQNDHRLVVGTPEPMAPSQDGDGQKVSENGTGTASSKTVDNSTLPADLNTLTVEQLKTALTARGVQFDTKMVKAELVALLTSTVELTQDGE